MDFMWRDYCPRVFRRLRKAAGIDEADYMLSLAGAQALRQLNSPGKSGSMFLLSGEWWCGELCSSSFIVVSSLHSACMYVCCMCASAKVRTSGSGVMIAGYGAASCAQSPTV
jgi:hypothetical protein